MNFGKSLITRILEGIVIIIIMAVMMVVYSNILQKEREKSEQEIRNLKIERLFSKVVDCAYMDKYTIYGNHLNIGGYILLDEDKNITNLKVAILDLEQNEEDYELSFDIEDGCLYYTLSENINEGIDLEEFEKGEYYIFLKAYDSTSKKKKIEYYSITNKTEYNENEYYTLTKNNSNMKLDISLDKFEDFEYMKIVADVEKLPKDVCDIVIDAGHGGHDPGAMYKDEKEAEHTLEFANLLKKKLEELGYKVMLTRTKDEYVESYDSKGRAILAYETKAKLLLSIHLNSTAKGNSEGGVEIYTSGNRNLDMAKSFADNIVSMVKTNYSVNNQHKVFDGVYVRNYSSEDIEEAIEYAKDMDYEPYENLTTDTPYYFMIRETGGIMTRAYVDGRNKSIGDNPYSKSNIAAEAYLLELGFINSKNDLKNIKENKEAYIEAIVKTIVDNYDK